MSKITSHNSWTFLPVKQWYLKPFAFMARCQSLNITQQMALGIRSFDLRIRFKKDGLFTIAHGMFEYESYTQDLIEDLNLLNKHHCTLRIIHEVRNSKQNSESDKTLFRNVCDTIKNDFPNLILWGGTNLYTGEMEYDFGYYPSCEGKYASVSKPKYLDDWFPWLYAKLMNKNNIKGGTNKDLLMIDFVEI